MDGVTQTTLLTLSGDGVPPYSARGLRQSLTLIDHAKGTSNLRRTVNGTLIDLTPKQMRKFKTTISGSDQQAPAFNALYPGMPITVSTVVELAYLTANSVPDRLVAGSFVDGAYTFYRLQLSCLVMDWEVDKAEWDASTSWKLDLEEV